MMIKQRFLSLGAGVQSSTLALMIERGQVPMVKAGIFADTGAEPAAVYKWFDWLKTQVSYPIYKVKIGDLYWHTLWYLKGVIDDPLTVPFFIKTNTKRGSAMIGRRCTYNYKILPINMKIRRLLGIEKHKKLSQKVKERGVDVLLGISSDELMRMKTNRYKYFNNVYPLIDLKMTREDCINWMKKNYNKTPPRSSCIFCPYRSDKEWIRIKNNPEDWKKVVEFDRKLRSSKREFKFKNNIYLHYTCKPIDEVKFKVKKEPSKYIDACEEGYCGV